MRLHQLCPGEGKADHALTRGYSVLEREMPTVAALVGEAGGGQSNAESVDMLEGPGLVECQAGGQRFRGGRRQETGTQRIIRVYAGKEYL